MANFGPLTTETGPIVWGIRANFNGFRVLASLLQRSRSPEANQTFARSLVVSWAATLYIHYGGASAPYNGILPGAKRQNSRYFQVLRSSMLAENFRRGYHLYSAGRPSLSASAHILVQYYMHCRNLKHLSCVLWPDIARHQLYDTHVS